MSVLGCPTVSPSTPRASKRVRLRPQDPFDLIRLLARSQSDPRKAVGELVQNSLDAGASRIDIEWFNHEGRRALRIWDDGEGVFPELEREAALRTLARTIGHSHKLDLTPAQRRERMVQGQYGIGLIGFWSVGEVLDIKSRVAGSRAFVLRLREDRATGEVSVARARKVLEEPTFTEVTIRRVHSAVVNRVRPPRLQAYLANELRGQLLERGAIVRIRDRVARGRARKEFVVQPRPYLGLPLEGWHELDVPGFESARVELYLVSDEEERRGVVSLSCGGTLVLDDIAEIDGVDVARQPWARGVLEGIIDFPELHVAPGTRRGFAHDEPVAAFLAALEGLEHELEQHLEEEARRRVHAREEDLTRDIRRAFQPVVRSLADYDFFGVAAAGAGADAGGADGAPAGGGSGAAAPADEGLAPGELLRGAPASEPDAPERAPDEQLFPPGPLARVELKPRVLRLPGLATRGLTARALDADGRPCAGPVEFTWQLCGPGELVPDGRRARYTAPEPDPGAAVDIVVRVRALHGAVQVEAQARVQLAGAPGADARVRGIPEPRPVAAPGQPWRSRFRDGCWEYNEAHRDYLGVAGDEARRLAYLIHLLVKELVLRNFGRPGDAEVLERMVEVLTYLGSRPGGGRGVRRKRTRAEEPLA